MSRNFRTAAVGSIARRDGVEASVGFPARVKVAGGLSGEGWRDRE
jgi:hypothetical protein